jgi:HK97 family phage prohead protease
MTTDTVIRKGLPAEIKLERGQFTARISTDALDRDGEIVVPGGMNSKEYERAPVVFWNHDRNMPIGQCVALKREERWITATAQFATRPENWEGQWFPDFAKAMVEQRIIRGVSIGFVPLPDGGRHPTKGDREKWGDGITWVHSKWKLLEFSLAPLQANPEALVLAVGKGLDRGRLAKCFGCEIPDAPPTPPPAPERKRLVISIPAIPLAERVKALVGEAMAEETARRRGKVHN